MTDKEYFAKLLKAEAPIFEKVLKALPEGKLDYKPHPKSRSALEIASVVALNPGGMAMILKEGKIGNVEMGETPHDLDGLVKMYKEGMRMAEKELASISDEDWEGDAVLMFEGKEAWRSTKGEMVWGFLFDGVHHRGQLSAYIRPMGGKVPSIYGPSGDDMGEM